MASAPGKRRPVEHHRPIWMAAALALAAVLAPGCDVVVDDDGVRGSGTLAREERQVSGFDAIALEGTGDLIIDVGATESLIIEAEDNLLPLLTSRVDGSTLKLIPSESISPTEPITYTLGATSLKGISISGSGNVVVPNLDCSTFEVSVSGSGTFDVGGVCDGLDLSIAGSAVFDGERLVVARATVSINGNGDAIVNATDELVVSINGAGDVRYVGDPATEININGSGNVSKTGR